MAPLLNIGWLLMAFKCPNCCGPLAGWLVKQEPFECPACKQSCTSNSSSQFKQAIYFAIIIWLIFLITMRYFTGSWGYAAVVSIEAGGILAAMFGALFYQLTVRISKCPPNLRDEL